MDKLWVMRQKERKGKRSWEKETDNEKHKGKQRQKRKIWKKETHEAMFTIYEKLEKVQRPTGRQTDRQTKRERGTQTDYATNEATR